MSSRLEETLYFKALEELEALSGKKEFDLFYFKKVKEQKNDPGELALSMEHIDENNRREFLNKFKIIDFQYKEKSPHWALIVVEK